MKQAQFDLKGFSKAIKKHRSTTGISLRTAAAQLKIVPSQLCRIEQEKPTNVQNVLNICEWMGSPIANFYKIKSV